MTFQETVSEMCFILTPKRAVPQIKALRFYEKYRAVQMQSL